MKSKTALIFDDLTGEFARTCEAHESPREPGVFHAPQFSTYDPLPAGMTSVQRAVRRLSDGVTVPNNGVDGSWLLKDEHRGETWYDKVTGAPTVIDTLDIPSNLAATKPVSILLEEAKTKQSLDINTKCATAIVGGFDSNALGASHHYTATLEDQANLIGLITNGTGGEYTCTNAAMVKARRLHTFAELKAVLADGVAFKDRCLARARLLKDQIAAIQPSATAVADVEAIVWTLP